MKQYKIQLTEETALFYERIARQTGRDAEQVLSDALFKLAGELALEALHKKDKRRPPAQAGGLLTYSLRGRPGFQLHNLSNRGIMFLLPLPILATERGCKYGLCT